MVRCVILLFCFTAFAGAQDRTEIGEINGASFRIDVPANWNGILFVYCHGYSTTRVTYDKQAAKGALKVFLDAGAAVAQSGYATTGWAIQQATVDTESLRRYFVHKYGKPKRTYVTGHSMGGFLTMMLVETQPTTYDGGLSLCGPLVPAGTLITRAFDFSVLFNYFFPGAIPDPGRVPANWKLSEESNSKLQQLLDSKPEAAETLRRYAVVKTNKELAGIANFLTFVIQDIEERAGGNPVDNRGTVYTLTGNDNDLNRHIKRYTADPRAFEYLHSYYHPTGRLFRPLLQVHTTYDPLVSPSEPNSYLDRASEAGRQEFFVQQFVEHEGHCNISPEETGRAAQELRDWVENQKKPDPGLLTVQQSRRVRSSASAKSNRP
jgi:pimeloyl-ACP methyl ester carboxylesterase